MKQSHGAINGNFTPTQPTENAQVVLKKRYFMKDDRGNIVEDAQKMWRRVADALAAPDARYGRTPAQVKETAEQFYRAMASLEYLPNSPTIMNAGTGAGTLSACFVLPLTDSMEGIMGAAHDAAMVQKFGGGTGFALSEIRPKGAPIKTTHGKACGPIAVLRHLSSVSTLVTQGGKRDGANMAVMDVHHPDVMEFIDCKAQEGQIHNFNISVGASDEFMRAVEAGTTFPLREPQSGKEVGRLDARKVFRKIVYGAWRNGEPGMIFLDEVNRNSPVLHVGRITATNPCVTADTWVHTSNGPRQVRELVGKQFRSRMDGAEHPSGPEGFFRTDRKRVVVLSTREGYRLRLTADHRVRAVTRLTRNTVKTEWRPAGDLMPGDRVLLNDHRGIPPWTGPHTIAEGYLLGLLVGDGTLKSDKAVLSVWGSAAKAVPDGIATPVGVEEVMAEALTAAQTLPHRADFAGWQQVSGRNESRLVLGAVKLLAESLGMTPGDKAITPDVERCSSEFYRGFLRGLFDTDGSVQGHQDKGVSVRLAQSDIPRLEATQRMLLRLGIASRIYRNRRLAGTSVLPDGKGGERAYATQAQHELVISGENLQLFHNTVGFAEGDKSARLSGLLAEYKRDLNRERFVARVESVLPDGVEDVYDVQVPGVNAFDANGFHTHNCGEQPLLPNESCNLGSIDVSKFVTGPYATGLVSRSESDTASLFDTARTGVAAPGIDWPRLGSMVRLTVHFLDNVIDANKYAVKAIEDMTNHTRKIGLGVMGFADMLIQLGIPYDSEQGIELGRTLMRFIMKEADAASAYLARQRGPYPAWEGSAPQKRGETPMRNACRLTVAPTGTISMIAGCSSGIEPVFSLAFRKHNILEGQTLYYVDKNFKRVAEERAFHTDELMGYLADGGALTEREDVPEDVRRLFHAAADISPENHVQMQAAFQESTDAGISKTINFPNSATIEDVERAYVMAWKTHCKGITVYRAGSREKEVLTTGHAKPRTEATTGKPEATEAVAVEATVSEEEGMHIPQYVTPRDRPETIQGVTRRMRTGHGNMYITINVDEHGQPFEVFSTAGKAGSCDSALTDAVARLVSLALRSGVDPEDVVRQLRGITCHPNWDQGQLILSAPDAIAIVLDKQLKARAPAPEKLKSGEHGQLGMFPRPSAKELGRPTATSVPMIDAPSGIVARASEKVPVLSASAGFNGLCPDCSAPLAHEEGCLKCYSCGFSKC